MYSLSLLIFQSIYEDFCPLCLKPNLKQIFGLYSSSPSAICIFEALLPAAGCKKRLTENQFVGA